MSENRINEKKISVRKQKVKKNHIREKLIFFYSAYGYFTYHCCFCEKTLSV